MEPAWESGYGRKSRVAFLLWSLKFRSFYKRRKTRDPHHSECCSLHRIFIFNVIRNLCVKIGFQMPSKSWFNFYFLERYRLKKVFYKAVGYYAPYWWGSFLICHLLIYLLPPWHCFFLVLKPFKKNISAPSQLSWWQLPEVGRSRDLWFSCRPWLCFSSFFFFLYNIWHFISISGSAINTLIPYRFKWCRSFGCDRGEPPLELIRLKQHICIIRHIASSHFLSFGFAVLEIRIVLYSPVYKISNLYNVKRTLTFKVIENPP